MITEVPTLLGAVITYAERRGQGRHVFDEPTIRRLIDGYWISENYKAIQQVVAELFSIAGQGRRPWSLVAEQSFLTFTSLGYEWLVRLRAIHHVEVGTFRAIDPLTAVSRIEQAIQSCQCWDDGESGHRRDHTLEIFDRIVHFNVLVFDHFATDYPDEIKLPAPEALRSILEIDDDGDFARLLTAFAKTRRSDVEAILLELEQDEELEVRALAGHLRASYFR